jgi:hypothetical protein
MSFTDMPGYSQGDQVNDVAFHVNAGVQGAGGGADVNGVLAVSWGLIVGGLVLLWVLNRVFR